MTEALEIANSARKKGLDPKTNVEIYVRRGGPNYKEGLKNIEDMGKRLGIPTQVYGPETHMTKIVSLALDKKEIA